MKFWKSLAMAAMGLAALCVASKASFAAAGDLAASPHNLSRYAEGGQLCQPCHTPHQPPAGSPARLLWNRTVDMNKSYSLYNTAHLTRLGPTNYVGLDATTRLCLSCHDGASAIDKFGNLPGNNTYMNAGYQVGTSADLTREHPIGLLYPGMKTDGTLDPAQLKVDPLGGPSTYNQGGFNDPTNTTYKISLKTAPSMPDGTKGSVIGCGSCHGVHSSTAANGFYFLRMNNTGSALCLSCHVK